mmetsp:Transcript_73740/g.124253  ORF Transcript_73740/g.124253 Transcript_73740/m.124253 type:complete len:85 (+) Transcript_73740:735-989(+)
MPMHAMGTYFNAETVASQPRSASEVDFPARIASQHPNHDEIMPATSVHHLRDGQEEASPTGPCTGQGPFTGELWVCQGRVLPGT